MSRVAKRSIFIPSSVKVNFHPENISAEGSFGKGKLLIPTEVKIIQEENKILTKSNNTALAGTYNSLISNLITGVEKGYEEVLEVRGIGYKVVLKDNRLEFELGKSRRKDNSLQDLVDIPPDLKITVERNKIIIKGVDKQRVTSFAANDIRRSLRRMPSVYKKNKGIFNITSAKEKLLKLKTKKVRK